MGTYAKGTAVSPMKTLDEIQRTLSRYGGTAFGFAQETGRAGVTFEMRQRRVRFIVPLPSPDDDDIRMKGVNQYTRTRRTPKEVETAIEQASAERWRALLLVIKAKLESIESGIESFEEAFQAQLVLPSGQTVGDWLAPQIEAAYRTGAMPPLLPGGGS